MLILCTGQQINSQLYTANERAELPKRSRAAELRADVQTETHRTAHSTPVLDVAGGAGKWRREAPVRRREAEACAQGSRVGDSREAGARRGRGRGGALAGYQNGAGPQPLHLRARAVRSLTLKHSSLKDIL